MDAERFDRALRALATPATRRSGIGLLAGLLLAGSAAAPTAADRRRTKRRGNGARRGGKSGAGKRAGVAAAADGPCPERVTDPNHVPTANGCGAGWKEPLVPEGYKKADFVPACTAHDICYGTCNSVQAACDEAFLEDLIVACRRAYPKQVGQRGKCVDRARLYYQAVSDFGGDPWREGQHEACVCCTGVEKACDNRSCCNPCEQCFEGTCLPFGTTCGDCQECNPATGGCQPVECADPCQECRDGACRPKQCGACEECTGGRCVPLECGDCSECKDGRCVPVDCGDPCSECVGNACRAKECPPCEACTDGVCNPVECGDPCQECREGRCRPKACGACEECREGACRPVQCGACQKCSPETGTCQPLACDGCRCGTGSGGSFCVSRLYWFCKRDCDCSGHPGYVCVADDRCSGGTACAALCR